ncbi:MAG: hypothetical protein FJ125_00280 [Deltaproteobacteria bacterium]|nr:hypothetical protein [Deltaproteobacteria bacterium]
MGAFLTTASTLQCPHGGSVQLSSSNTRALADGAAILRAGDTFTISGCPFMIGSSSHPCVRVQWVVTAQRNQAAGDRALTEDSVGLCLAADSAPQGTVIVASTQRKAAGL